MGEFWCDSDIDIDIDIDVMGMDRMDRWMLLFLPLLSLLLSRLILLLLTTDVTSRTLPGAAGGGRLPFAAATDKDKNTNEWRRERQDRHTV